MSSRDSFKDKRIAVVGLGPHGEMIEDVKFLINSGALVSVYDLRSEARLRTPLAFLRSMGLANYVCGSIPTEDLLDMDIIILSYEYPRQSSFLSPIHESNLQPGQSHKIAIEYPETLFFKHAPPVTVVGLIGSCGKSTIASMLSPMLEAVCKESEGQDFFYIDPESSAGTLSHLRTLKSGDIVLVRIVESMMKELYAVRMSPHVAIITSLPPKGSYDKSPFEILEFQMYNNFILASNELIDLTHSLKVQPKAKMLRTTAAIIPPDWLFSGRGSHDRDNAALALQAARLFKVSDDVAEDILARWKSLKGRIELIKKVRNIEFYNDSASISPFATEAALVATASDDQRAVLIFGGARGYGDYRPLYSLLPRYVSTLILLPGSGTLVERSNLALLDGLSVVSAPSIEEAVRLSLENAKKGEKVIFSPGFEAGGFDRSRKDRGDRFVRAVRAL